MYKIKLKPRLAAVASFVGKGSVADIGTDHAQLPIYLVQLGHPRALASDINEGPCQRARTNIYANGLHGKIKVVCCPGLDAVEDFKPDNIVIAGMGGEMIASILEASEYPKSSGCRLVLQPQSMQDVLRRYLSENGFCIDRETVVSDGGKYYQVLAARYDGTVRSFTDSEYRLGELNLRRAAASPSEVDLAWLEALKKAAERRISGREATCDDSTEQAADRQLVSVIDNITNKSGTVKPSALKGLQ